MALGFPAFGRMFELHRSIGVSQRVSDLAVSIRCCWLFLPRRWPSGMPHANLAGIARKSRGCVPFNPVASVVSLKQAIRRMMV